ncbi:MAG: thioredoxin domain-containing protein [Candidatus Eiseniibacteriota bacterium]
MNRFASRALPPAFTPALLLAVFLGLLGSGSGSVAPAHAASDLKSGERAVVFSLTGLDCSSCFDEVLAEWKKVKGFKKATFDRRTVEATVVAEQAVGNETLVAAVERAGFKAYEGPGKGAWLPPEGFPDGSDVTVASKKGEDVGELASLAVPGKVTVVDFYADWCGPCRAVDRHMAGVLESRKDVAVRKLNIVDWDTPVAKKHLKGVSGIPYVVVFGKDGKRVSTIQGLKTSKLDEAIAKGGAR